MLDALTPGRLAKVTRPLPGGAASPEGGEAAAGTSARRIRRRSARLARAIDKAGGLYLPDRLHAVRIAAKKLRYALELQRAIRPSRATGQTRALKAIQDLLGHMHDLEVLLEHLRAAEARGPAADADTSAGLHRLVLALERECRGLHAVYVTKRDALVRLCAAVGAAFGVVPAA
jgi:CHAD domain-containing protein